MLIFTNNLCTKSSISKAEKVGGNIDQEDLLWQSPNRSASWGGSRNQREVLTERYCQETKFQSIIIKKVQICQYIKAIITK